MQNPSSSGGQGNGGRFRIDDPDIRYAENAVLAERVNRLERDMSDVKSTLTRMEPLLARIDERVRTLPGKGFVIATVIALLALVIGVIGAAPYLRFPVGP